MELVKAQTIFRQLGKSRRLNRTAEGLRCAKANIVDQYDDHVGGTLWGSDIERWRRRYIAGIQLGNGLSHGWLDG